MALLDAGLIPARFTIDAVDISAHALARAERAVYGKNSFRGRDLAFRDRYFQATKDGYALNATVRATVKFRRENILDDGFLTRSAPYDFILCRNLLIYFDRSTQVLTLEKLHRLLSEDGVLFVGPAEMPLVTESGFVSANLPLAFACRKANGRFVPAPVPRRRKPAAVRPVAMSVQASLAQTNGILERAPNAARAGPSPVTLETARQLADTGRIAEAISICEEFLTLTTCSGC
jgi:chemotaxis protein methyltransferase WspC